MAEITLAAEVGRPVGSRPTRRLRAQGRIPGVVYGHGMDPLVVSVVGRDLRVALSGDAGANALLSLRAGDTTYLTLAREMQRDPVRGTVTHVDFVIVRRDEVIQAEVPVTMVGEAAEVNREDGLVDQQLFTLTVNALPTDIPTGLEVDVSELTIGASIRVSEISLPRGVSTEVDPEAAVVVGQPPRVVVTEEEEEAAAEGEALADEAAAGPEEGAGDAAADEG